MKAYLEAIAGALERSRDVATRTKELFGQAERVEEALDAMDHESPCSRLCLARNTGRVLIRLDDLGPEHRESIRGLIRLQLELDLNRLAVDAAEIAPPPNPPT